LFTGIPRAVCVPSTYMNRFLSSTPCPRPPTGPLHTCARAPFPIEELCPNCARVPRICPVFCPLPQTSQDTNCKFFRGFCLRCGGFSCGRADAVSHPLAAEHERSGGFPTAPSRCPSSRTHSLHVWTRFPRSLRPVLWLFSGWNWQAKMFFFITDDANSTPYVVFVAVTFSSSGLQ
jgi:hypothetical protein